MIKSSIHINSDLGEGLINDARIMPFISSVNVACGGHTGDERSMTETIRLAQSHEVQIGAHPSYPDRMNFGRQVLELGSEVLKRSIIEQLTNFFGIAKILKASVKHVKPHGALYNEAAKNPEIAKIVINCIMELDEALELYAPFGSVIADLAVDQGIKIRYEAFADRNYNDDLSLVSRNDPNAIVSMKEVLSHVSEIANNNSIRTVSGKVLPIDVDTVCVHGDNPEALEILQLINENFEVVK